jgi:hypothetical protein
MATIYFNNANTGTTDWNDSNWYDQPGASGNQVSPSIGDTLIFETSCNTNIPAQLDYYITVQNGATLSLNTSDLTQDGIYTMQVNVGGVLNINGSTVFNGTNNVDGTINISSSFSGYNFTLGSLAVCNVYNTAYLYYGSFSLGATINVTGTLFLNNYTINAININVTNALLAFINCVIATAPTITGSNISFTGGSTITTNLTLPANTFSSIIDSSVGTGYTITNNGTASLQNFSGNGAFINNNICSTSSSVSVSALTNNGALTVGGGTFGPTIFTNNNSTTVDNNNGYLSIRPASVFTNNGTFTYGTKYTTRFKGEIFPQVPSSASWGNALL